MKKLISLALATAMALTLVACGPKETAPSGGDKSSAASTSQSAGGEVAGLTEPIAEQPILLTSGGQSADYNMIGTLMEKAGMDFVTDNDATGTDLGNAKTLIVGVGGSSKGLGAAGIDADGELARLDELITAAKDAGMTVIAMHTGGQPRRGDLSDKFITPVFEAADYAIVVESGDTDGLMQGICSSNGIPMDLIASITDVATVLPAAFK